MYILSVYFCVLMQVSITVAVVFIRYNALTLVNCDVARRTLVMKGKEEIRLSPMTKVPLPTNISKTK